MAGQSTVLSADGGNVTVPSSGLWTATGIQQVQSLLFANNVHEFVYNQGPTALALAAASIPTVPAGDAGTYVLEIQNGTAFGSLAIPDNYGAAIFGQGSTGSVTGGTGNTTVLSAGSISYSGNAGEVVETSTVAGTTGTFVDNATGAVFDFGGGNYSVTAGGNQQKIQIDNSAQAAVVASGNNDTIILGDPTGSSPPATLSDASRALADAAALVPGTNLNITGRADVVTVNTFGNVIADHGGGSTTISGISGASTIFAAANDVYFGGAATTEFISGTGAQTVFGGTGNDTVFNNPGSSLTYNEGTGSANVFVAGGGNSTIYGNGSGAVFGGSGQTALVLGNGNDVFVGGTGGSDSIYGGSVTPTIFGGSNENAQIVGSHASFVVAGGDNSSFNASLSNGGNNFFATSLTGNTTLVGANGPGPDTFNIGSVAGGSAHTLTIENWHTGDGLFLGGYSQADVQTMDTAVLGGKSAFTLSDGTTVTFGGGPHPTHVSGNAIF